MNGMGRLGGLNIIEVGAAKEGRSYLQLFAFYKNINSIPHVGEDFR